MRKTLTMVFLGFLFFSLTVVEAEAGKGWAMTSPTSTNRVTIDGRWTNSKEWTDALQGDCGGWGWVAIKDDSNFLYVLLDYVKDVKIEKGDFGWVIWDQKNNGGTKPADDDYDLYLEYTSTTTFQSVILQGTGVGWGNQKMASSIGISANSTNDATNDPYSSSPHVIYEFQVPRLLLDNSTTIATIGSWAGDQDSNKRWIASERTGDYMKPSTWNSLTFSIPVPEFSPAFIMAISVALTAIFVSGRRKRSNS